MKKYLCLVIITELLFIACASIRSQELSDSILVKQNDDMRVEFYTKAFMQKEIECKNQRNFGRIMEETRFDTDPELKTGYYKQKAIAMLEEVLSKENLEKLSGRSSTIKIGFAVDQDGNRYGQYCRLYNSDGNDIHLSHKEMRDLLTFVDSVNFKFITKYPGTFQTIFYFIFPIRR